MCLLLLGGSGQGCATALGSHIISTWRCAALVSDQVLGKCAAKVIAKCIDDCHSVPQGGALEMNGHESIRFGVMAVGVICCNC